MGQDDPTLEGATGEPNPAAAGSQGVDAEPQHQAQSGEPTQAADDFPWDKLRTMSWDKIPQDIRARAEEPFLRQYTRKATEWNDRQARTLDAITQRLEAQGVRATPDEKLELKQRLQEGDMSALDAFVDRVLDERLRPVHEHMQQTSMDTAISKAASMHPWVREKEQEVAEVLRARPELAAAAQANGYAAAPAILAGIAADLENRHLKATQKAELEKALAAERARGRSLPASTSKAGSTPSATPGNAPMGLRAAMEAAAVETERILGRPL